MQKLIKCDYRILKPSSVRNKNQIKNINPTNIQTGMKYGSTSFGYAITNILWLMQ